MVRRSNVHFKLTVLKQLTLLAMASIDANYWTKCIQHMFKEIDYYIYYDNIDTDDEVIPPVVINEPEALPMDIDVSNKNLTPNHYWTLIPPISLVSHKKSYLVCVEMTIF